MGMDFDYLRGLARYWLEQFDWRATETRLNAVPQFQAHTDSGTIHFVHIKSRGVNPVPIILTHGWPSTFAELLRLGAMLADPSAPSKTAPLTFDVVIPSLPGYGFSSAPTSLGMNVFAIADRWSALMAQLGYRQFIAHGGDIGAGVATALGLRHSDSLLGIHLNYIPGSYAPHLSAPAGLSTEENEFFALRSQWMEEEGGYSHVQATKPDVLGAALNDSPLGLAAWLVDKFRSWSDCSGDIEARFTHDELLSTVCIYWFTRSITSAMRLYWENRARPLKFAEAEHVNVPVGVAHFPREIPVPPRSYVERGYKVTRWTEMPRGGHFAALEEPELLAADIRAFTASLR